MPCGPLQIMQLYTLGTGSAFKGSLSMFAFSLGTVPLMLAFGALSGLISKGYTKTLLKFSGILVVVLGIVMGSRGFALVGINLPSTQTIANTLKGNKTYAFSQVSKPTIVDGVQIIEPSLKIQKNLTSGENIIEFTPTSGKDTNFSCGMGMIRGVIKVVDNIESVDISKPDSSIPTPSSSMPCCK